MLVRFSELRCKEVINLCDGARLGFVSDLELDEENGRIVCLIVPCPGRFFGLFGNGANYVIPWAHIRRIGGDLILVDADLSACRRAKEKRQKIF